MSLPEAIATSGAAGAGPRPRPLRAAIVAGVLAAVYVLVYSVGSHVPGPFAGLFGMPRGGVPRFGGLQMTWRPPPGADPAAIEQRFARAEGRAVLHREGDAFVVEVTGVRAPEVRALAEELGAGPLEFREVIETPAMLELLDALGVDRNARHPQGWDIDQWVPEEGGGTHTDYFLKAYSPEQLDAQLELAAQRGWTPPQGTHIAYERVEPAVEAKDPRPYWRTYVLADAVELDGDAITSALKSYDPNTNRPIVLIDFDRAGGEKFGELTSRIVGRKLAIVVGGRVRSAPIINGAIRGGRASITMGGSDPQHQEREAELLATTLRAGPLPRGGEIVDARYVTGGDRSVLGWIVRVAFALVIGGVIGLFAWLVVRVAQPVEVPLPPAGKTSVTRRVLWTIAGCVLLVIGTGIVLPGVNRVEMTHVLYRGSLSIDVSQFSVLALGIRPVITAFIVIELVALAVPRLRPLRETPEGRRRLARVVAIGALAVAGVQAYFMSSYLQALSRGGAEVVASGTAVRWMIVLALTGGVALSIWIAALIGHRGIGNGYAVLIVAGWLLEIVRGHVFAKTSAYHLALGAVAAAIAAVLVVAMLRWRVRGLRGASLPLPISGQMPVFPAVGLPAVVAALSALQLYGPTDVLLRLSSRLEQIAIGVLVIAAILWSWINARPGLRRGQLERAGVAAADRAMWVRATVFGTAVLIAIYELVHVTVGVAPVFRGVLDATVLMFTIATLLDVSDELRARSRGELIPVWPLASPLLSDAVREKLASEGIAHHLQSANLRSLLWFFGPHVPIMVLVPPADAERAAKLVREIVG